MQTEKIIGKPDLEKIRKWLGEKAKKVLVYHRDADGVCSAAIFLRFFPDFATIPREGPILDSGFFKAIIEKKPKVLVFLDMPIDQEWQKIVKLMDELQGLRIVIIDHHLPEKDMNSERIIHINPMLGGNNVYIPASCVVYELFREMGYDVKRMMWISIIGIIGDYGMKDCAWMLKEYKRYGGVPHCELGKASDIISSAITLKGVNGAEKSLGLLMRSMDYDEFKGSKELARWNVVVQREVRKIVNDFEKRKELVPGKKLIFYEIKSRMNITSIIATITAEKHPDAIIVIRKKAGDQWKISLRYQAGKISVGDLAKYASKGIGSGGGHVKSSGALVNDWEKFRDRAFEYLK